MDAMQQLEKKRDLWRRDILAFCRDVLWWRTGRGVEKWTPYAAQAKAIEQALAVTRKGKPRYKTVAFCWPKRQGKSTAAAALLCYSLVTCSNAHSVVVSASRENAQTVTFEALLNFIRHSPMLQALIPDSERQKNIITCPTWGNWVRALPANENTVQGIAVTAGGWAVFDDAHSTPLPVLDMVASQTEQEGARILVPSMMGSTRGYVYRLWQASKTDAGAHICFNYWHGDNANRNPHVPRDFLPQRRAELAPPVFAVLHENEPGEGADCLFTAEQLAACRALWLPPQTPEEWQELCRREWDLWPDQVCLGAGLDRSLGAGDDTVFSVVARYEDKAGVSHFAVVRDQTIRTSKEAEILAAAEDARKVFGMVNNAIAEVYQMADVFPKWRRALGASGRLEAASGQAQATAFNSLWQTVNEGRFHYPAAMEALNEQLAGFKIDTNGRLPRFTGGSGKAVDDHVYALCWATVAARKKHGGIKMY